MLFIYLIAVLIAATAILSALNVGVQNPTDGSRVVVKNLLSVEGLHWFLPNVIKNFSGFAPLGAILALVLGAGFAERVGLLPALMVKMASHVSARYASYMVLFIAFFSHISSDAALVKRQIDGGTDAIIVCGTTGEPATMTERKAFGNKMCGRRDSRADSCNSGNRCQLHTKCDRFLTES